MNLHEYQSKEILASYNIKVQRGILASTTEEAVNAAQKLSQQTQTKAWVVKAQVHAGGRGKGGGVKFCSTLEEVRENSKNIIGMQLITPQTPPEGKKVNYILIAEDIYYTGESPIKEYYISILLDRQTSRNIIVYSTEGGMDIEEIAKKINIDENDLELYGKNKAKINYMSYRNKERKGKLVLVTAITPTKQGEGKTTMSIGIADGLRAYREKRNCCIKRAIFRTCVWT